MGVLLNLSSLKIMFPERIKSLKELNDDSDIKMTAKEMIIKVISGSTELSYNEVEELTGLSPSSCSKILTELVTDNSLMKDVRKIRFNQPGNSGRAFYRLSNAIT